MNQQININDAVATSPLVDFWNAVLAPKFIKYRHILVGGLSRHSEIVFPILAIEKGQRILDVGCGLGDTAFELAIATGTHGEVVGVDCCEAFLDHARNLADRRYISNLRFLCRDVESGLDAPPFDMVFARFGTVFFANPVAGLQAIRTCLRLGGRLAHIVRRKRSDNAC